jgi:hypothetical protein
LLGYPVVADVTRPNTGQNTLLFSMFGAVFPSANGVHQTRGSQ